MKKNGLFSIIGIMLIILALLVNKALDLKKANSNLQNQMVQIVVGYVDFSLSAFERLETNDRGDYEEGVLASLALSISYVNNMEVCFSDMTEKQIILLKTASQIVGDTKIGNLSKISLNIEDLDC